MFPSNTLLSLIFITVLVSVDASPLLGRRSSKGSTLPFNTRFNLNGRSVNIAQLDRARAQSMKSAGHLGKRSGSSSFSIINGFVSYDAQVGVGTPPINYTLLIDTGSANTWIGANASYTPTSSSVDTGYTASVNYGTGNFTGEEWLDTVTLSPSLIIQNQSLGVANSSTGVTVDGILGVGPIDLTSDTVSNNQTVPTVIDNLYSQGTISEEVLGIYFVPSSVSTNSGELTFGGYDNSVTTSSVSYVPLTTTSPASTFWGIDQSVSYGGETILSTTAGIVDTGTTLVLLATDAFQKYQNATGAVLDSATGLLSINTTQYDSLLTLSFNIGGNNYDLTPNAQIWPRSLNSQIGGDSSGIYLIVSDIGTQSGSGLDFMNGYTFLERYYSVYDTTNGQVGFASTAYTDSTAN